MEPGRLQGPRQPAGNGKIEYPWPRATRVPTMGHGIKSPTPCGPAQFFQRGIRSRIRWKFFSHRLELQLLALPAGNRVKVLVAVVGPRAPDCRAAIG